MPALKAYEKQKNLYDFRDRLRGYLGLPRRRSSISKGSKTAIIETLKDSGSVNKNSSPVLSGKLSNYDSGVSGDLSKQAPSEQRGGN